MSETYDILVIGGGPGGYIGAFSAKVGTGFAVRKRDRNNEQKGNS